jgi:hypothetical protein
MGPFGRLRSAPTPASQPPCKRLLPVRAVRAGDYEYCLSIGLNNMDRIIAPGMIGIASMHAHQQVSAPSAVTQDADVGPPCEEARSPGRDFYLVDLTGRAGTACFYIKPFAIRRESQSLSSNELEAIVRTNLTGPKNCSSLTRPSADENDFCRRWFCIVRPSTESPYERRRSPVRRCDWRACESRVVRSVGHRHCRSQCRKFDHLQWKDLLRRH